MAYGPVSIGGYMSLSPATKEDIGGVKIGNGINVAEDGTISVNVSVDTVFPVGSIYLSKNNTSPAELFGGTWVKIASERVLMGASDSHKAGSTVEAGLPNITGKIAYNSSHGMVSSNSAVSSGCVFPGASIRNGALTGNDTAQTRDLAIDASRSSAVYGRSDTVQPPALYINIWERVS